MQSKTKRFEAIFKEFPSRGRFQFFLLFVLLSFSFWVSTKLSNTYQVDHASTSRPIGVGCDVDTLDGILPSIVPDQPGPALQILADALQHLPRPGSRARHHTAALLHGKMMPGRSG